MSLAVSTGGLTSKHQREAMQMFHEMHRMKYQHQKDVTLETRHVTRGALTGTHWAYSLVTELQYLCYST
jgi:hypothetical protein